jgi:oxygen-independent coproporphyrinogen-3 oxidase
MLLEAGYFEIGMDHFALCTDSLYQAIENKTLHRNFMGYTTSKTRVMIGLGVSAISDSWYGFAQNVKGVEEYQNLIENNISAIYRCHILTKEDLVIRKHILNLMCNFKTTWFTREDYFEDLPEVIHSLKEMYDDGLVEFDTNFLKITEHGKPFVRNICMAFDMRLQRNKPETQLFSMTV